MLFESLSARYPVYFHNGVQMALSSPHAQSSRQRHLRRTLRTSLSLPTEKKSEQQQTQEDVIQMPDGSIDQLRAGQVALLI